MFCPKCGEEFPRHVMICPTCDVDTIDRLPGQPSRPDVQLVRILVTGDAGIIAIAKSLLESEEIDYFVRGDGLQDLFGLGRLTGFSFVVGPAEFWVRADDADRARDLLGGLTVPAPEPDSSHDV
jgi:hypothetical protein